MDALLPYNGYNYTHPELRVLQEFLQMPEFRFDDGFEELGLGNTQFQS